ncbi:MAG TPA: hypothetical protein VKL40_00585, partial [Candidatus Angelobacter sp.]|nr:hypothetical protein [Candidatus Angelobacter sp.]
MGNDLPNHRRVKIVWAGIRECQSLQEDRGAASGIDAQSPIQKRGPDQDDGHHDDHIQNRADE